MQSRNHLLCFCLLLLLLDASDLYCQVEKQLGFGVIREINDNKIILSLRNGERREVNVNSSTKCVKVVEKKAKDLKIGDFVVVRGIHTDLKRIRGNVIIILPEIEARRSSDDHSMRNRMLFTGKIIHVKPLTVRTVKGDVVVELSTMTIVFKEIPIELDLE